jgi:hypothetical protein
MTSIKASLSFPPRTFLSNHRQSELSALFSTLEPVKGQLIPGAYKGALFAVKGLDWLPAILKVLLYRLLTTWLNPWRGKAFSEDGGSNLWGIGPFIAHWGFYCFEKNESEEIVLDYGVEKNAFFLKPIMGEIRVFQEGLYLARMQYRAKSGVKTLLYFTLEVEG